VLDMLHATKAPQNALGQVVNLLGGLAPVRNVETAEQ
jgi:hypothetical protein